MMLKYIKNNYETKKLLQLKRILIIREFKVCIQICHL